jgi:hypothetical protein
MHHTSVSALGASYAEAAGFNCAMYSDHFRPWDRAQAPRIRLGSVGCCPADHEAAVWGISAPKLPLPPCDPHSSYRDTSEMFPQRSGWQGRSFLKATKKKHKSIKRTLAVARGLFSAPNRRTIPKSDLYCSDDGWMEPTKRIPTCVQARISRRPTTPRGENVSDDIRQRS